MNRMKLDKGEMLVTMQVDSSKEGFIVSVKRLDCDAFGLHIKISTDTGDIYNIVFPLKLLRSVKGII